MRVHINENMILDKADHTVTADDKTVSLTPLEYRMLECLADNIGHTVAHDGLAEAAWGPEYFNGNGDNSAVRRIIKQLRNKLKELGSEVIETTSGAGYKIPECRSESVISDKELSDNLKGSELSGDLTRSIHITKASVLFRDDEYAKAKMAITNNKSVVLTGFGGNGKTSVARLLYSDLKSKYDFCGWINYNGDLKNSMIADIELDEYSDRTMTENDIQKKWKYIIKLLKNNKKSKLFVIDNVDYIDGVQSPFKDEDLAALSGWENIKIIITTRLSAVPGYDNVISIDPLGNPDNCERCIELFYFYNPDAAVYRDSNCETVRKICELAGYNTMAIELLAKDSIYDADALDQYFEKLQQIGFKYADEVPVETNHDFNHIEIRNEDGSIEKKYYDRGNETAASQLMKLFNMKQRSPIERQILWDFHCLPKGEKVSRIELNQWLGYSIKDISGLNKESWIKDESGYFFMHPLVNQAVSCTEEDWGKYWDFGEERRRKEKHPSLISMIKEHELFDVNDSFVSAIRKIYFADYLSYEGRFLEPEELLYIADYARKRGVREIASKYYRRSFDRLYDPASEIGCLDAGREITVLSDEQINTAKLFWKSTYFYGYILSYTKSGYDDAENCLMLACKVIQMIRKFLPVEERDKLQGMSLDHYGYVKSNNHKNMLNNFVNACMLYRLALNHRVRLVQTYPDNMSYYKDLAWTLDNLGTLFAMADYDKLIGEKGSDQDLCIRGEGPLLSYDEEYDFFMNSEGKAEEYLKNALDMRRELAEINNEPNSTEVAWTCCNIASLLSKNPDRYEDAEKMIEEALHIYNELDKEYPEQHLSSLARTYTAYGRLLSKWKGRKSDALQAYKNALELNKTLEHDYPGVYIKEIEVIISEIESITREL